MQLLFKIQVNGMKIDNFRNLAFVDLLADGPQKPQKPRGTSKVIGGWIQWPDMQILFNFQVNGMKTTLDANLRPMLTFWSILT